jgi:MOSC domain-containing protein YiiM
MKVTAIHLAPGRRLPMRPVDGVVAEAGKGLVGDRYHGTRHRHVTIQSQQALDLAAGDLGHGFPCSATCRTVTVDTGDLPTRPGERIRIGEVELEVVRIAAPCRLMDDGIGKGAMAALRNRAGSVFPILTSGTFAAGDPVEILER